MEWILFIFKKGNKHYLIPASSEEEAWDELQKKLSWNMNIVKKSCQLIHIMNENSGIIKI